MVGVSVVGGSLFSGVLGPTVIWLACRRPVNLVDPPNLPWHFVSRDLLTHERIEAGKRRVGTGTAMHDSGDTVAVPLVRDTDHQRVEHVRVALECGLHFLWIDLLAAAVDRLRAAAEHRDAAVRLDLCIIARNRIADTVEGLEGLCGLLLILVVAHRDVALLRDQPANTRARLHLVAVLIEDDGAVVDGHARSAGVRLSLGHNAGPTEPR